MVGYDVEVEVGLQPITGPLPHAWIYMLEGSGRGKGLHTLILGCDTPVQIPIRILLPSSCTDNENKR